MSREVLTGAKRALYDEYIGLISNAGQIPLHPGYPEHLERQFSGMTTQEIRSFIEVQRPYVEQHVRDWLRERQRESEVTTIAAKYPALKGGEDIYARADGSYERVVCADTDPRLEKRGMPMYRLDARDAALRGYSAVHVGDADRWIPILMRDGYCDGDRAFVYKIDAALAYRGRMPFYEMDDFHIRDKTAAPPGIILFSKREVIPAKMITLKRVVDLTRVRPARYDDD